tara:strand:- start:1340 stop:1732 length:393 start_codon:yes stop_codon:yes gene_type:complete
MTDKNEAAKPKKETKASLVKKLKDADIPVPKGANIEVMKHRLKHYKSGVGYLVRPHKLQSKKYKDHPMSLLTDKNGLYWLPASEMADRIIKTKLIIVLSRTNEPSNDATIIDVPIDYAERFGYGSNDKSN